MSILRTHDTVTVWLADGIPDRLVWDGRRYRVTDRPTPLADLLMMITHPPTVDGWRFQATDESGTARVFDVRQVGERWELISVYD